MDTIETQETFPEPAAQPGILLSTEAQYYLTTAGKWANFLGILGFIFCALFLIPALSMGAIMSKVAESAPYNPMFAAFAGFGGVLTVFYIVLDVLYFFFALYLYQFATKIKAGIKFSDSATVTVGLGKLKSFFKLWGIVTIVIIVLYVVAIIGVVIFAASMASSFAH